MNKLLIASVVMGSVLVMSAATSWASGDGYRNNDDARYGRYEQSDERGEYGRESRDDFNYVAKNDDGRSQDGYADRDDRRQGEYYGRDDSRGYDSDDRD